MTTLSIYSGELPLNWISANVVPVHKKGDKHLTSNISSTSIVVNACVKNQTGNHQEDCDAQEQ